MFEHLNEGYGTNDVQNNTAELEKHLAEKKKAKEMMRQQIMTEQRKLFQFFGGLQFNHLVFLLVLGSLSALTAYAIDVTVFEINSRKAKLAEDNNYNFFLRYICWISFHWICMMYCAAVG